MLTVGSLPLALMSWVSHPCHRKRLMLMINLQYLFIYLSILQATFAHLFHLFYPGKKCHFLPHEFNKSNCTRFNGVLLKQSPPQNSLFYQLLFCCFSPGGFWLFPGIHHIQYTQDISKSLIHSICAKSLISRGVGGDLKKVQWNHHHHHQLKCLSDH